VETLVVLKIQLKPKKQQLY